MPSASNKLEKQASIGSVHAGGGGGGPGVQPTSAPTTTSSLVSAKGQDANSNANVLENLNDTNTSNSNANVSTSSNINEHSVAGSSTNNNNGSSSKGAAAGAAAAGTANANALAESNNPLKPVLVIIEHKIRNLEKRKTKLESYRAIQATGKELSSDQKAAVAKYEAVTATLEFARDLYKQVMQLLKDAEKEQKKQARKDGIARAQAETHKIREVLTIQNILLSLTDETMQADFLNGENGAVKLDSADLAALKKFNNDVQTRRPESADDIPFLTYAQKAAEYFSMTIDSRPKQYSESMTFENLHRIFNQIQACGYLDKIYQAMPEPMPESKEEELLLNTTGVELDDNATAEDNSLEDAMDKLNVTAEGELGVQDSDNLLNADVSGIQAPQVANQLDLQSQHQQQSQLKEHVELQHAIGAGLPPPQQQQQPPVGGGGIQAPPATSVPNFQPQPPGGIQAPPAISVAMFSAQQMQPQLQQVPPGSIISVPQGPPQLVQVTQPPQQRQLMTSPATGGTQIPQGAIPLHGAPPPGHFAPTTVRAVEQSFFKQQQQQFINQIRPLAEVISGGSFYFLQDSELDSPEIGNLIAPTGGVFEQPQQPPQQQQAPSPGQPQQNLLNHAAERPPSTDIHKAQQQQQQLLVNSMQVPPPQQQQPQPIPTQTFTNQSFPPMQPPSTGAPTAGSGVTNSSNTATLASNTPSPMFQPNQPQQQLFSPVSSLQPPDVNSNAAQQQQLLLNEQQQQVPPPMMIMTHLAAPQAQTLPPQSVQQPQPAQNAPGMQPGDVSSHIAAGFLFENSVVSTLSYDQQMQQQLAAAATANSALKANVSEQKKHVVDEPHKFNTEPVVVNEWEIASVRTVNATRGAVDSSTTNAAATAALTNALKPGSNSSASTGSGIVETNKWSTEMNSIGSPQTPSNSSASGVRKNEWSTGGNGGGSGGSGTSGGGYGDAGAQTSGGNTHESNHWNSNQNQDGGVHFSNNGRYQRRRGRPNNYGNSSTQQNGGGGGSGGRGGGGGMYFRNNENSSSSGSYYQNGSGNVYSKDSGPRYDSGGSYRGPRGGGGGGNGGGNSSRGSAPPSRSIGGRGGGGGNGANTSSSYINPRQSNRMPMGLENKN